jgi:diphosphomevalonate decarboxylase
MHLVMQTQEPPRNYWNDITKYLMSEVVAWRRLGLSVYFTIDAGPNVHLICEGKDQQEVYEKIQTVSGIESVILNKPATGAHISNDHLF